MVEKVPLITFPFASVMDADPDVGLSVLRGATKVTPEGEVTVAEGAAFAVIVHPEPSRDEAVAE